MGEPPNELTSDTRIIDAEGSWVTPGIIDVHSRLGVYPSPGVDAHSDGNEATAPVTAEVWAEHSVWPQDPGFGRALAGGIMACLLYTSPSPRDEQSSRMPSSA